MFSTWKPSEPNAGVLFPHLPRSSSAVLHQNSVRVSSLFHRATCLTNRDLLHLATSLPGRLFNSESRL